MEDMLKDFMLGEHLLLVGNQVLYFENKNCLDNLKVNVWSHLPIWALHFTPSWLQFLRTSYYTKLLVFG